MIPSCWVVCSACFRFGRPVRFFVGRDGSDGDGHIPPPPALQGNAKTRRRGSAPKFVPRVRDRHNSRIGTKGMRMF